VLRDERGIACVFQDRLWLALDGHDVAMPFFIWRKTMLNFTENMKRISQLADKALIHTQEEKYPSTRDDIILISICCNEALQQLDEMVSMKSQGKS